MKMHFVTHHFTPKLGKLQKQLLLYMHTTQKITHKKCMPRWGFNAKEEEPSFRCQNQIFMRDASSSSTVVANIKMYHLSWM